LGPGAIPGGLTSTKAVRFAQRFAQSTLDAMTEQICVLDGAGAIVAFNAAWQTFSERNGGVPESVLLGSNYLRVCDAATSADCPEAATFAAGLRQVLSGGTQQFTMDYACHSPEEQRWFLARATRFEEGGEVCVVVAHQDVSALKRVEEQLRLTTGRLEATIASTKVSLSCQDGDLRFTWVHNAAHDVHEASILGKRDRDLTERPAEGEAVEEIKREVLRTGQRVEREVTLHHGGCPYVYDLVIEPLQGPGGSTVGVRTAALDVTDRKREVTARLDLQERLARVERSAAVGTLVAGVAHEINNPLTVVMAGLDFVQEKLAEEAPVAGGEAQGEALALLGDAAVGARRIRDVVAALRLIAPGRSQAAAPVAALRRTLDLALALAGRALAPCEAVETDLPPLPELALPAADLVQVLTNLLINAGQARGDRPNRVTVCASQAGPWVEVQVRDTGVGMAPAVRARAFEAFFSTKGVGEGKGLGLSVAQGIVQAAGGTIDIESVQGAGTCVTFRVPSAGVRGPLP
jgi:signal transduction histidine kinase